MDLHCIVGWALLLAVAGEPLPRFPGAVQVAYFDFADRPDRDFVKPDDWTRIIRLGYPFYVDAVLTDEAAAVGRRSLVFRMNGGHSAYFSPPLPASNDYSYVLQAQIKTTGLRFDQAFVLLEFLDDKLQLVGPQHLSQRIGGTQDWMEVRVGPVGPINDRVRHLRIACLTQHGPRMDLAGSAFFDDLWVGRLPRVRVEPSSPDRLFEVDKPKSIKLEVTGAGDRMSDAVFHLSDENHKPLATQPVELRRGVRGELTATWNPPLDRVGFYHARVELDKRRVPFQATAFTMTVMRPPPTMAVGEFGLSAPAPTRGLDHDERMLQYSASRWLKLPLWASAENAPELSGLGSEFAVFVERMRTRGQRLVGVLERAPATVLDYTTDDSLGVADVFLLPRERWGPSLENSLARFGLQTDYWQLGGDDDTSFEDLPNLEETLRAIQSEMARYGREPKLGVTWNWPIPSPTAPAVSFTSFTDSAPQFPGLDEQVIGPWSPLSADVLYAYLRGLKGEGNIAANASATGALPTLDPPPAVPKIAAPPIAGAPVLLPPPVPPPAPWVQITPLSSLHYSRKDRIIDLALRMAAAKAGGADAIFAGRITHLEHGLVDSEGAPTELFTIWRTMAENLGDSTYLGEFHAPKHVRNRVFSRNGSAVIVAWSDREVVEEMVVGDRVNQVDLWGRSNPLAGTGITRLVALSPTPIVLQGVNEPLARFQIGAKFIKGRVSATGGRQTDLLQIVNPFPMTIHFDAQPRFPASWRARTTFRSQDLAAGQTALGEVTFDISRGAFQGDYEIPIDFHVVADREYRFRLERPYRLGQDQIETASLTTLLPNGTLEVEVALTNLTEATLNLRASLRAFEQPVQSAIISSLSPRQITAVRFYLPNGVSLLGRELELDLALGVGQGQITVAIPVTR